MKKLVSGLLACGLALSLEAVCVSAANRENRSAFTDADRNGICDNRTQESVCPRNGGRNGFLDENLDGVCDKRTEEAACPRNGDRCQNSRGCGNREDRPGHGGNGHHGRR